MRLQTLLYMSSDMETAGWSQPSNGQIEWRLRLLLVRYGWPQTLCAHGEAAEGHQPDRLTSMQATAVVEERR